MTKESRFFDALRDVFVGAKVDGESGYINLMRIKSRYYTDGVFPRLKEDIAAALQPFPEFREVVCTFRERRDDGTLVFDTAYSERGTKTKVEDTLRALRKAGGSVTEDVLTRAFRVFEKQSEVDYFINKDARAFLEEQFDLWMYQYLFKGVTQWTERRIKQLQALKDIAFKIIAFIAQFEDELVKIWNKPKFVLNSRYVITLDRIVAQEGGWDVLHRLLAHAGMAAQVAEWKALGMAPEDFQATAIVVSDLMGRRLAERWEHLPLDTAHFKDLELDILGLFDHLDDALDGWLIKSENYQALVTLGAAQRHLADCCFIDPPYNTSNDEFEYLDGFQHGSWLALMHDRLRAGRDALKTCGVLFATIDDTEVHFLRCLIDEVFGAGNFIANIVWQKKQSPQNDAINLSDMHDHILVYARHARVSRDDEGGWHRQLLARADTQDARYTDPDNDPRGPWASGDLTCNKSAGDRPNLYYGLTNPHTGQMIWPSSQRVWRFERSLMESFAAENRLWWGPDGKGFPRLKRYRTEVSDGVVPSTWWSRSEAGDNQEARRTLRALFPPEQASFATPKPVRLVERAIAIGAPAPSLALDFFAGSGTTAHAVMNLNRTEGTRRKYILIEMAEYCDTVILPRIKKVAFSDKWKDGKAVEGGAGMGHFMKYYALEQYEDTLRKARYQDSDLFDEPDVGPYHAYVFLPDLKTLEALEVNPETDTVKVDLSKLYDGIDVPETLSNLTGKHIRRITRDTVEFEDGTTMDLNNLDWRLIRPLIWW